MKAKEYLKNLQKLDTVINQKLEELNALRIMSHNIRSIDYSKNVQTNKSNDAPFVQTINRMVDLEKDINREIDEFVDKKHSIVNQIQGLSEIKHIQLLYKKYVQFKSFETIAVELCYSYQYILELHGAALTDFEKTYKNL